VKIDTSEFTRPFTARTTLVLLAIVIIGAALRLRGLASESVWLDEAFAIGIARAGLDEVLYETRLDVHPPLYYIVLHAWTLLAGASAWSARLLSVIFSLGILVMTHVVGTRLAGRRTGLFAAAMLAVSIFHIEFSQEARMYTQLTLLATLSTYGFIRLFEPPRLRWFLLYVIATSLMTYTHVYAMFIIGAQGLTIVADLMWRRRDGVEVTARWVAAQALVFTSFLPWLPVFTWQVSLVQTSFWIAEPETLGFLSAFRTYAGSNNTLLYLLAALAVWGGLSIGLTARPAGLPRPVLLFLFPWMAGPILFPFVLSLVSSPIFLPKYTIAASVPFALLAAAGISRLPLAPVRFVVLALCLGLHTRVYPAYFEVSTKDGWQDAVPVVEAQAGPEDAVVLYPYFNKIAFDFYRTRPTLQVRPFPLFSPPPPGDGWPATFARATAGRDRVWFVALRADTSAHVVLEQLHHTFDLTSHQVKQRIAIYRFDRR